MAAAHSLNPSSLGVKDPESPVLVQQFKDVFDDISGDNTNEKLMEEIKRLQEKIYIINIKLQKIKVEKNNETKNAMIDSLINIANMTGGKNKKKTRKRRRKRRKKSKKKRRK